MEQAQFHALPTIPKMIDARNLTKAFGAHYALRDVSLQIDAGETVILVGPNGSGKTTLLRILATLYRPTGGSLAIAGLDPLKNGAQLRTLIGFLSHRSLLYEDLSAEQNLVFYARMYGLADAAERIPALLNEVGLFDRRHDLVRTYSRGMQQRLAVARAVLHRPSILLLDEPHSGLDPLAVDTLNALLDRLTDEGCTLILTTHTLERFPAAHRRTVILYRGRVVFDAPIAEPQTFPALYRRVIDQANRRPSAPQEGPR